MDSQTEQRPPGHRLVITWDEHSLSLPHMHKYGGIPSNGARLPTCSGCGSRFHLLFQIDLADPNLNYLELDESDYFFILTCLNCASYWEPMYYRLEDKGRKVVVLQAEPRICVRQYPDILEEHSVSYRPLKDNEYPLSEDVLLRLLEHEGKHQLGGMPTWVHREEHITCIACGGEMEYVAMADSELYTGEAGFRERGHMFGDEGILYTFVCRRCGIFAAKAQGL